MLLPRSFSLREQATESSSGMEEQSVLKASPTTGFNIYVSSLLLASQVEPPPNLCLSFAKLHRINSDAEHDVENLRLEVARRYQRMGRGDSPRIDLRDSMSSP